MSFFAGVFVGVGTFVGATVGVGVGVPDGGVGVGVGVDVGVGVGVSVGVGVGVGVGIGVGVGDGDAGCVVSSSVVAVFTVPAILINALACKDDGSEIVSLDTEAYPLLEPTSVLVDSTHSTVSVRVPST